WYPRWRAFQEDRELTISRRAAHDGAEREEQMELHVGDGTVELRCDGALPGEPAGRALSALGLLIGLGRSRRDWRRRLAGRLRGGGARELRLGASFARRLSQQAGRPALLALVCAAALAVALVARNRGTYRARLPGPLGQPVRLATL